MRVDVSVLTGGPRSRGTVPRLREIVVEESRGVSLVGGPVLFSYYKPLLAPSVGLRGLLNAAEKSTRPSFRPRQSTFIRMFLTLDNCNETLSLGVLALVK